MYILGVTEFRQSVYLITVLISFIVQLSYQSSCGNKTFRVSFLYNDLKPLETPLSSLTVSRQVCAMNCFDDVTCTGVFTDNDVCYMYSKRFYLLSFVKQTGMKAYEHVSGKPADCYDVMMQGNYVNGVFTIQPRDGGDSFDAFCEISHNTEGWLVIQRRTDGSEEFYRGWDDYKTGFGNVTNEFWLGNERIYRLTNQSKYDLRFDLEDFDGNTAYAEYKDFSVSSEADGFRLSIGAYSGNAGDAFGWQNHCKFTTKDKDLDNDSRNCAVSYKGAWWYNGCHSSNLNGQYLHGTHTLQAQGLIWKSWRGEYYSLKTSVMKIRRSPRTRHSVSQS